MNDKPTAKSTVQIFEVGPDQDGQRLDNFLTSRLKGAPKTLIYRIIRKGEVRVDSKRAKPDHRLDAGARVRVPPLRLSAAKDPIPPGRQLQQRLRDGVLYEDEAVLVINKPAGLAVHGGTGSALGLIEALRAMYPGQGTLELVHRLDKGTSGCVLLAKTGKARRALTAAFRDHQVGKVYHALVGGTWPPHIRTVDANLQRQPERGGERRVEVDADGKSARTDFRILQSLDGATLVEAKPLTGRTHQIRVHAALAGCPLIGDDKYATVRANAEFAQRGVKRLCLHAVELRFPHPETGRPVRVSAPYDTAFTAALATLAAAG